MYEETQHFPALYARAFPWKTHIQIDSCTNVSTGWEGELLCLGVAYEEEDERKTEEIVLKLYYGQEGMRKARSEFNSLHYLADVGYPAPRALFAALEDSPFGRPAVAMEKIQGQTAAHMYEEASQEQQQALITRCSQLYVDLHALDWEPFVPDPEEYRTKDVIQSRLMWARMVSDQWLPGVFDPVLEWLEARRGEIASQYLALHHGDFHLENVLVRDDGKLFVIDWTGTSVSDYRFDLAWTLLLQRTQEAEGLADAMLGAYERLVGHQVEQLEFFEVLSCFKRLFEIVVSLKSGATQLGIKPDAEGEMKQQVDRIQAVYTQLQERIAHPLPEVEDLIRALGRPTD